MAKIDKRIEFLAEKYEIFMEEELGEMSERLIDEGYEISNVKSTSGNKIIAIICSKITKKLINTITGQETSRTNKSVKIHEDLFASMIGADPTPNKIYLQWMLTVFTKLIKEGEIDDAIRFALEDLPQANEYLTLFNDNKRKRLFGELCESNFALRGLNDPTNINQYKSLAQLFDAVDPFIEKDVSALERSMKKFVDAGKALIPVKDRNYTLFIPLTLDASVLFDDFAAWCTVTAKNGEFVRHTNQKTPISNKSKIYIIIDNKFFKGEYDELSGIPNHMLNQIHFESRQIRDRSNGPNVNIYDSIISKSDALANFFYEELTPMAKQFSGSLKSNYYIDYLIAFGFTDVLFDILDEDQPSIMFNNRSIPKLPDLSRFKNVETMYLSKIDLREINPSVFSLPKLALFSVPNNKLRTLPKEIGYCRTLKTINIIGNKLTDIPDEIGLLDKSNGGGLHRISVNEKDIGENNYKKLKRLLPTVNNKWTT